MGINVERKPPDGDKFGWVRRHPLKLRIIFGDDNPRDYGWLVFNPYK